MLNRRRYIFKLVRFAYCHVSFPGCMEKMMGKGDVGLLLGQKAFFLHLLQFKLQECTTIDGPFQQNSLWKNGGFF